MSIFPETKSCNKVYAKKTGSELHKLFERSQKRYMKKGSCKKPNCSSKVIFDQRNVRMFTDILTQRNLVCYTRQSIQGSVTVLLVGRNK